MITPFYVRSLARATSLTPPDRDVERVADFLNDREVDALAKLGKLTVAMIRPSLPGSVLIDGLTDLEAAERIEERIENLGVITKFSVIFDEATVDEFYAGTPKEVQLDLPPERYQSYPNRWVEFSDLMQSGKSTVLLLHSQHNDAIELWRKQVGHYDVVNRRDESTIRGQLAIDNYNNLIHGSDSPVSAQRELRLLANLLTRSY